MPVFHGLAIGFALLMLVRHLPGARQRQPVAIFTCVLAVAVLAFAVKGLAGR
jgi:ABC-type Fe3+ transport system permease subunit